MDGFEDKLQVGDVILTCGRGFALGSLPIRIANFFKRGYRDRGWTHAAIYIGNGEVVEAFPGGVVHRNFKESYLNGKFDLLALRRKKIAQQAIDKTVKFCVSAESKKYDFRALIYFALYNFIPQGWHFILDNEFWGKCFNVNDSYFCSELVATGFMEADAYCFENSPYKVMPIDFYNDIWFDTVVRFDRPEDSSFLNSIKNWIFRGLYFIAGFLCPLVLVALAVLIFLGLGAVLIAKAKSSASRQNQDSKQ